MPAPTPTRLHAPSAIAGAIIALAGIGVGAFMTDGPGTPRALALSPEAGSGIPAIELDRDTAALIVDQNNIVFMVNANAVAIPVQFDEQTLRNNPGHEILRAR